MNNRFSHCLTVISFLGLTSVCASACGSTDAGPANEGPSSASELIAGGACPAHPPHSPGNGKVGGIPQGGGGALYYCKDALLGGFDCFERFHEYFPLVIDSSTAEAPNHDVVDMAYALHGTMTLKNVDVPADGVYRVDFRYAFAFGLFPGVTDRAMGVEVNGRVVSSDMHFPITHSFYKYEHSTIDVHLRNGQNEIGLFNISNHGVPRLDTMTITPGP